MGLAGWFADQGWTPFGFQAATWAAYAAGESGLVHVPTGAGKTYAAFGGPFADLAAGRGRGGLHTLYLTPLRAVARDIEEALTRPVQALGLPIRVESRTGDTSGSVRAKQRARLPEVLVTTPESLALQLTDPRAAERFSGLACLILDEWHALLGQKRGALLELALARVRALAPAARTWALSATLRDPPGAAQAAVGVGRPARLISAPLTREVRVLSVRPERPEEMPWAGRMGFSMLPRVLAALDPAQTTLLFTNTRNQAESWFQAIARARPDWVPRMGLHHSTIDAEERTRIEKGLGDGSVTLAVCTGSLDLGVDFGPVQRVFNIGSPKGIARLIQRAGRAAHQPGQPCEVVCVPTHALELVEIAAARDAIERGDVEPTGPLDAPLDVLVQHLVSCAVGGGFEPAAQLEEVRTAASFAGLTDTQYGWALALLEHGGATLKAYPEYHRITRGEDGRYHISSERMAKLQRLSIGTIVEDTAMSVVMRGAGRLGSVEERFIAGLRPGETFAFGGQVVALAEVRDFTAFVKKSSRRPSRVPAWGGGRLPISACLAEASLDMLDRFDRGEAGPPEMEAARPILEMQARMSRLPGPGPVLAELCSTEDGSHLFVYPFAGRAAHEGMAALLALRLGRRRPASFALSMNDHGFELVCEGSYPYAALLAEADPFDDAGLLDDVQAAVNLGEMARRRFRDTARIAGLVFSGFPGKIKTLRQIQTSSSLLFDVFRRYDPDNLLLYQVRREVLAESFEFSRLRATLARCRADGLDVRTVARPTPFGMPLVIDRLGSSLSTESLEDRVARLLGDQP
ncbi:MAG: ligase-associated DNA damage response DEXH box helicase [Myxococcales bacterium]|nr:ligase-associated DNA damage response DEXH box helicase [Myxococcales bacterium]